MSLRTAILEIADQLDEEADTTDDDDDPWHDERGVTILRATARQLRSAVKASDESVPVAQPVKETPCPTP